MLCSSYLIDTYDFWESSYLTYVSSSAGGQWRRWLESGDPQGAVRHNWLPGCPRSPCWPAELEPDHHSDRGSGRDWSCRGGARRCSGGRRCWRWRRCWRTWASRCCPPATPADWWSPRCRWESRPSPWTRCHWAHSRWPSARSLRCRWVWNYLGY